MFDSLVYSIGHGCSWLVRSFASIPTSPAHHPPTTGSTSARFQHDLDLARRVRSGRQIQMTRATLQGSAGQDEAAELIFHHDLILAASLKG